MQNAITVSDAKKLPALALEVLRDDPGSFARVARRLNRSKTLVSRVARGERTSARVRRALLCEARRLAKLQGYKKVIEIEEAAQR